MLTDVALKNLKPNGKPYKVADRDGMYVSTGGAISFRFDYRMHGRRETLTLGRYGPSGLSLHGPERSAYTLAACSSKVARLRRRSSGTKGGSAKRKVSANLARSGSRTRRWPTALAPGDLRT